MSKVRAPAPKAKAPPADTSAAVDRSRRRFRRATIVLSILIALPLLLILTLLLAVNPIARKTAETLGSTALKLPVAVDRARVNIAGGAHLYQVSIGNPRQFKEVRSFRLGRLDAAVTLPSLFNQTVEVQDLLLENPELIVEFDKDKTNWGAIFDTLAKASTAPPEEQGRKFIIHRIRLAHPIVIVHSPLVPKGVAIHLRDIELRDVGTAPGSASPTSLVLATIFQALISGAIDEWTGVPGELSGTLNADVNRAVVPFEGKLKPSGK